MRIVFISNYFNHHQQSVCDKLNSLCESFYFISTSVMREERRKMGYAVSEPAYVIHAYEESNLNRAIQLIHDADVIIAGSVQGRLKKPSFYRGKNILYYSERLFKIKPKKWQLPLKALRYYNRFQFMQNSYMLCSGAYAAGDFYRTATLRQRYLSWGYFPKTKEYQIEELIKQKKKNKLLWCGRLLTWKHAEHAIEVAKRLKSDGISFSLDIIGTGETESGLKTMIKELNLDDCINMLGGMNHNEVRSHMENAGVFLFTSDRQEGWGAVLNEAMNSGCAVVSSTSAGSVPYLIKDGENGFSYDKGNVDELYRKTKKLLEDIELQEKLGKKAYTTIAAMWNAETASERLFSVSECIADGKSPMSLFKDGPCSKAELIIDK